MPNEVREDLDKDPEALVQKYCPVCRGLRPSETSTMHMGQSGTFCEVRGASWEEISAFDKLDPGTRGA